MTKPARAVSLGLAAALAASALLAASPFAGAAPPDWVPAAPPGLGRLAENNTSGEIAGTFVSLFAPANGSILQNYTSEGVLFFDAISVDGYALEEKTFIGSLVKVAGTGATAQVHDNPSSILKVSLDSNTTAVFHLAIGISPSWGANGTLSLAVDRSNRTASMWTTCGANATILDKANNTFAVAPTIACHAFFRSHVLNPSAEALITQAAESRKLAAEVYVGASATEGVDVSTFGEADVIVTHADGRVVVSVASSTNAPTSVLIRFANLASSAAPTILVDGRPVRPADSLEDSLDATDDGADVEYSVSAYDSTGVLVVSMPSPGSHVIEIQAPAAALGEPSSPLLGAVAALGLVAVAAFGLFRRR